MIKCSVKACRHKDTCTPVIRKNCTLRKYYLQEQIANRKRLASLTPGTASYADVFKRVYPGRKPPELQKRETKNPKLVRNTKIVKEIDSLIGAGYKAKEAFSVVAPKYFMSVKTARNIYYGS